MYYYLVEAKCGHVGRNRFIPIIFPVIAENGKEAAKIVRNFARVKHNHKDAILNVSKVDIDIYLNQLNINRLDPYFKFKNIQEQRTYNKEIMSRTLIDPHSIKKNETTRRNSVEYKLKKNKILCRTMDNQANDYLIDWKL